MFDLFAIHTQLLPFKNFFGGFVYALGILLLYLVLGYSFRIFILRYEQKLSKQRRFNLPVLLKALANPLFVFFVLIGLISVADEIEFLRVLLQDLIPALKKSSLVICGFWFSFACIDIYERKFHHVKDKTTAGFNKSTAHTLTKFGKALTIVFVTIFVMDIFGVDIRGILAVAGIGGAALGFASKDLLANFFGSIILFVDKPFSIGDWVKLSNGKEGEVEYIGWRVTKIRTYNTTCMYVANAFFSNMLVENYSKMTHRKIEKIIKLQCLDIKKLQTITKEIKAMLSTYAEIDHEKKISCIVSEFKETFVNCKICVFTKVTDRIKFLEFEQKIMFELAKIIGKHKLTMAVFA